MVNHLLTGVELAGFVAVVVAAIAVDWRLGALVFGVLAVVYANMQTVARARAAARQQHRGSA